MAFRLGFLKVFSSYFDSQWSFAQFKLLDSKTRIAFSQEPNMIYIIGYDGNFYTINFDPVNGGECLKQYEGKIFDDKK